MKRNVVLSLLVIFLLSFSITGMAADFVVEGGFLYTKLDYSPNAWGDITRFNEIIDDMLADSDTQVISFDKISDIDSAKGYYIGVATYVADFNVGVNYERFSADESGFVEFVHNPSPVKAEAFSELDISGFILNVGRPINEYLSWNIGVGRYSGTLDEKLITDEGFMQKHEVNVDSDFGYKIGLSLEYAFNNNWSLMANTNYRMLGLDYEIDKIITPNEEIDSTELDSELRDLFSGDIDLDGFEITAGLSYSF